MPMSSNPEARKRSMANLKKPTAPPRGTQRALKHGARAKQPVGDLKKAREKIELLATAVPPLCEEDGTPTKAYTLAVKVLSAEMARYDHISDYVDRVGPLTYTGKLRYSPLRELRRLEKSIMAHLHDLGLTPRGRYAMGLDAARIQALQHIEPVRTPERARRVAQILQRDGMLAAPGPDVVDGEVVEEEVAEEVNQPVRRVK